MNRSIRAGSEATPTDTAKATSCRREATIVVPKRRLTVFTGVSGTAIWDMDRF